RLPDPFVSVIPAALEVVSPQSTRAVCVSWVPASVNDALVPIAVASGSGGAGTVSAPSAGAALAKVTVATDVTGAWYGSITLNVAVTTASSLQVIVGESVFTPV